jgi:hypothetical protein
VSDVGDEGPSVRGEPVRRHFSRRRVLAFGLGGLAAVGVAVATGLELVLHGVLPGKQVLDELDGGCSVAEVPFVFGKIGPARSGTFFSRARRRDVGYTAALARGPRTGEPPPARRDAARLGRRSR